MRAGAEELLRKTYDFLTVNWDMGVGTTRDKSHKFPRFPSYPGVEGIQKAVMDLIDEFKDDLPTILRISQSNQPRPQGRKPQQVTIPLACFDHFVFRLLSSVWLRRGAISAVWIVLASVAAAWETENFSEKLTEQTISGHQTGQKCIITVRKGSLFEIISFPAKTALTSIMYASYAALIYLAVYVNAVLAKIKNIFQEEESLRQNRESENFRKAFSEPALPQPMYSEGEITAKPYRSLPEKPDHLATLTKPPANKQSNKIQVLHSVFDQSAELNESSRDKYHSRELSSHPSMGTSHQTKPED
ncbi:Spermatogenesis-associated protein 9 [Microtus ochrogaster]|uniref:Spermatogenesis-associated protein 9 n=1 Tax=Microtus ochrogaster TaxID=79684 RepID=A0A8J6G5U6_MICOH|nr:Spermatogenesis-associated protein 9 [Microtus ochrogaster]